MATFYDLEPSKSYATEDNAHKAVEKLGLPNTLRYMVLKSTSQSDYAKKHLGRFIVVFIGQDAIMHGVAHLGFNIVA